LTRGMRFGCGAIRLVVIVTLLGLNEQFGERLSAPDLVREVLDELRAKVDAGQAKFTYSVPASYESGANELGKTVLGFSQIRSELDGLGYDCTEVHRGSKRELFEAQLIESCEDHNISQEMVVGTLQRRPEGD